MVRRYTPLEADVLEKARIKLVDARRKLLGGLADLDADLRVIEESREIEREERSQDEAAADVLARLGEREFGALRDVQAALDRIAAGTYGSCKACGRSIATGRLGALPATRLCGNCASASEARRAQPVEASLRGGASRTVPVADVEALDDGEVAALVRETFGAKADDLLEDVRVICRYGVVTLTGWASSEELRAMALGIVEDELGLEAVDRIGVSAFPALRRRVGPNACLAPTSENEIIEAMVAGVESRQDIFEAEEEGLEYHPSEPAALRRR